MLLGVFDIFGFGYFWGFLIWYLGLLRMPWLVTAEVAPKMYRGGCGVGLGATVGEGVVDGGGSG